MRGGTYAQALQTRTAAELESDRRLIIFFAQRAVDGRVPPVSERERERERARASLKPSFVHCLKHAAHSLKSPPVNSRGGEMTLRKHRTMCQDSSTV
jgi:hypothetical protein